MRVHFSAAIPCALRLGGAPAGMCGEAEKFADLPEDEEVLVEFLPADGDYFPLGFLWNARRAAAPRGFQIFKYSNITEAITSDNGHLDNAFHVWDADGRIGVAKVINGKGKEIVPCAGNYDRIWGYESYGVIVVKNGKEGCIKENGATFCRTVYDGHINGMKRVGFVKNSGTSNDVSVDIYDYNGKYLTTVKVGNNYLDQRWFVQK